MNFMDDVKTFWDKRSKKHEMDDAITTFYPTEKELRNKKRELEEKKIFEYIKLKKTDNLLDLGCGWGNWSFRFSPYVKKVCSVDYCETLIDTGMEMAKERGISNVEFILSSVPDFTSDPKFDVIFCSGILQYLDDEAFKKTIGNISNYSKKGTQLIIREPTGVYQRFFISNKYSEELDCLYSSLYRTRSTFIKNFEEVGFKLIKDEDFFNDETRINRFKETRLRIYEFINR